MLRFLIGGLMILSGLAALNPPHWALGLITLGGTGLLFGLGGPIALRSVLGEPLGMANGLFEFDRLGGFFLLILVMVGIAALINLWGAMNLRKANGESDRRISLKLSFILAFLVIMILSLASRNLGLIWVAIEGTTLVSALLIGFNTCKASLEAAWKYVILCTVGLACSLFGLTLLLHAAQLAGSPGTLDATVLVEIAPRLSAPLLRLAFILILVGFAAKAGFAPLHSWVPDAYSQAPGPTASLLSTALPNCSILALLRFAPIMEAAGQGAFFRQVFLGFGLISLFLATLFLLVQTDLKRLLAYSSIEHKGLIAIGIGLGTQLSLFALLLHVLGHALAKALAFLSAGELTEYFHSQEMARMIGVLKRLPVGGGGIAIGLMALGGMPPFSMFFSEVMLVTAAFMSGQAGVGIAMLFACTLAFGGLVYQGSRVVLGEDAVHHHHRGEEELEHPHLIEPHPEEHLARIAVGRHWRQFSVYVLTTLLVLTPLALFPPFSGIIDQVARLIFGGVQ